MIGLARAIGYCSEKRTPDVIHPRETGIQNDDCKNPAAPLALESALYSSMLLIRSPSTDEFAVIGQIFHEAVHGLARPYYTPAQLAAWAPVRLDAAHWQRRLRQLEVRVADLKGALAGFIGFSATGFIDMLFTHPTFARRGVARELHQVAEAWLRERGVPKLSTEASLAARGFFAAMGYHVDEEQNVQCRGELLRNFRMSKKIVI
jgi:putative acetyltransferase